MKKNWIAKVAVLLLALTMITSCFVGSTFAKYVTRASGADNARVAKWGILLTMEGDDMFAEEYEHDDPKFEGDETTLTVRVDPEYDGDVRDLVAPGTTNNEFKATIVGKPEVAVRYTLHIEPSWQDVYMKKAEYTDFTELVDGEYKTFELTEDYAPVKWDITVKKDGGNPISLVEFAKAFNPDLAEEQGMTEDGFSATDAERIVKKYAKKLADAMLALINDQGERGASNAVFTVNDDHSIDLSVDFDPNRSLNFEFGLKWTWAYEQVKDPQTDEEYEELAMYDAADTWLGNFAAYKEFGECADYADEFDNADASYQIGFEFTATATQID